MVLTRLSFFYFLVYKRKKFYGDMMDQKFSVVLDLKKTPFNVC